MRKDLYQDLGHREDSHFWHRAKRQLVEGLIVRYHHKDAGRTKILDVGCGTSGNAHMLQQFGEAWGIDASQQAVQLSRKKGLVNILRQNAEKTSFKNNSFDVITILDLLEHSDDVRVLKEAYRILKIGGIIILTVPAYQALWSRWDEILGHKRRYNRSSLYAKLSKQHFQILKLSYCFSFLLLPVMIVRVLKSFLYTKADYPSDFALGGDGCINTFLGLLSSLERFILITLNINIPCGLSIIVVCRKSP